jgi:hypothetical protein
MDGTGAAGTSTAYARGDHQHPSDTTKVNKSGDTMTGLLTVPVVRATEAVVIGQSGANNFGSLEMLDGKPTVSINSGIFVQYAGFTGRAAPSGTTFNVAYDTDLAAKADSTAIAPAFSSSSTYAVGDYVTHEGLLYKCTTAVTTAGAWDSTKWTAVNAMGEMPAPITVDSAMSSSSTNPVQNKVVNTAIDGCVPWANAAKDAVTIGTRSGAVGSSSLSQGIDCTATGGFSHAEGKRTNATGYQTHAEGRDTTAAGENAHSEGVEAKAYGNAAHAEGYLTTAAGNVSHSEGDSTYAAGRPSHAEGSETTAAGTASHADGYRAVTAASGNGSGASTPHDYAFAWQGVSTGGYYRSHGAGTYNVNPVGGIGGFYVGEQSLGFHLNALPYASTTTLAPETAVYRATATLSGTTATMPTVTITGIPTASAYFAFELEVAVDATATAINQTAWSGWTWMDGGALPTSDYAGKTLFIACRLDCTARTIKANCYEVA